MKSLYSSFNGDQILRRTHIIDDLMKWFAKQFNNKKGRNEECFLKKTEMILHAIIAAKKINMLENAPINSCEYIHGNVKVKSNL